MVPSMYKCPTIATLWLGGPRWIEIFQFHVPPQFLLHWRGSLIYDLFEQCPWSTMPYCGSTWPKLAQQECSKLLEMTRAAAQNCLALLKVAQNCSKLLKMHQNASFFQNVSKCINTCLKGWCACICRCESCHYLALLLPVFIVAWA